MRENLTIGPIRISEGVSELVPKGIMNKKMKSSARTTWALLAIHMNHMWIHVEENTVFLLLVEEK